MTNKRKFVCNDEMSRKVKFTKLVSENSEKCEKSENSPTPYGGFFTRKVLFIQVLKITELFVRWFKNTKRQYEA